MKDRKTHGESNVWNAAQRQKRSKDLMLMWGLSETIDVLVMVNSVYWHGHVLRREDCHFMRRALDLDVEGQRKKWRSKRTWKKKVVEESAKVGLRKMHFADWR